MNRSWSTFRPSLRRARFLSTHPGSHTSPSRLRLTSVVFFASTGILVSSYLPVWPSKYWGSPTFTHQPMSPNYFVPATVSDISQTGPDLAMLTLTLPRHAYSPDRNPSAFDPIWSIFVKDDDIQIERPYTPLYACDENGTIKLWIKRYPRGEVGRWLHSRRTGDTIEIRGPINTFPFQHGKWDEIVMVCDSACRAPFMAHSFSSHSKDFRRNWLLSVSPVIISPSLAFPRQPRPIWHSFHPFACVT